MEDETENARRPPRWRFRFSIGSMLLSMAVVGLAISLALTYSKLSSMERDLATLQPLSPQEVARQFEKQLVFGKFRTKVEDVRYSRNDDAFRVSFSFIDPNTGQNWYTEVKLKNDGYGVYFGQISSTPFLAAVGSNRDSFAVAVKTPSPLKQN
jgi:hypothetical protein